MNEKFTIYFIFVVACSNFFLATPKTFCFSDGDTQTIICIPLLCNSWALEIQAESYSF